MPVVGSTPSQRDPKGRYSSRSLSESILPARWEGSFWPPLFLEVNGQFSCRQHYLICSWSISAVWIWRGLLPVSSSVKKINNWAGNYRLLLENEFKIQACSCNISGEHLAMTSKAHSNKKHPITVFLHERLRAA